MKRKIFGNEKTALHLTPKAEWAYFKTDPLKIIVWEDGTYSIRGAEDRHDMTAQDVIDWLEELADDYLISAIFDALKYNSTFENGRYWLHVKWRGDSPQFCDSFTNVVMNFSVKIDEANYFGDGRIGHDITELLDKESKDDPDFMAVVENFRQQVSAWMWGEAQK